MLLGGISDETNFEGNQYNVLSMRHENRYILCLLSRRKSGRVDKHLGPRPGLPQIQSWGCHFLAAEHLGLVSNLKVVVSLNVGVHVKQVASTQRRLSADTLHMIACERCDDLEGGSRLLAHFKISWEKSTARKGSKGISSFS